VALWRDDNVAVRMGVGSKLNEYFGGDG